MKFSFLKYFVSFLILIFLTIVYLSIVGIETDSFNQQIKDKVTKNNKNLKIDLKKIKLKLDPIKFKFIANTIGATIYYLNKPLELEYIGTEVAFASIIKNKLVSSNLEISTRSLSLRDLIKFARASYKGPELFILEKVIKKGNLTLDIKINYDENGKIIDNYEVNGTLKDGEIQFFKNNNYKNINFIFNLKKDEFKFQEINFTTNKINFLSDYLNVRKKKENFFVEGIIENKGSLLSENFLKSINLNLNNFNFENTIFNSINNFNFEISKKLKLKNIVINSDLNFDQLNYKNSKYILDYFPKVNKEIILKNHKLKLEYNNEILSFSGDGQIKIDNELENIKYLISLKDKKINFNLDLNLSSTNFEIDFLNYKKKIQTNTNLKVQGSYEDKESFFLNNLAIIEDKNKIELSNLLFGKNNLINNFDYMNFDYLDSENKFNKYSINKIKKNEYDLRGFSLNANNLITNLLKNNNQKNNKIFKNNITLNINLDEVYIDEMNYISNLNGDLFIKDNTVNDANLYGVFDNNKNISFTIKTNIDNKITTLYSSRAKPLVKRYKFIKGFDEGYLDFYSSKKDNLSISKLNIYDFKLKELPVLTKILTLASLQGIADILSGEGIRFDEFEMNFKNESNIMTIDEIYAIGPAISILMSGYVERDKLISLRGTLVPATTINKTISTIPVLGKILVGNKTGEGVFGVSFKIKGPPKELETSVNPIKTLTPRFITRTLEKIKKN